MLGNIVYRARNILIFSNFIKLVDRGKLISGSRINNDDKNSKQTLSILFHEHTVKKQNSLMCKETKLQMKCYLTVIISGILMD